MERSGAILMLTISVVVVTVCRKPYHCYFMVMPLTPAHLTLSLNNKQHKY